jgi:hypothetical protein
MALDATSRRRWLGVLLLASALALLLLGDGFVKARFGPWGTLLYWLACLVLTLMAAATAVLDLRAVHRRSRQEERQLLQETLQDIQEKARKKPTGHPPRNG